MRAAAALLEHQGKIKKTRIKKKRLKRILDSPLNRFFLILPFSFGEGRCGPHLLADSEASTS
jgi:hypothetical protein